MDTTNTPATETETTHRCASGRCWGPDAEQHVAGCTLSRPRCRWRRRAVTCYCSKVHHPHRRGTLGCGDDRALEEQMYGPRQLVAPAVGEQGMTEARWWLARCAIVAHLAPALMMGGGKLLILSPETLTYYRALLAGEQAAPPSAGEHGIANDPGAVRRWFVVRRTIVELLMPLLLEDGTVVPVDLGGYMHALLVGAVKPPVLPNARTLAKTKAEPFTWTPPSAEPGPLPF